MNRIMSWSTLALVLPLLVAAGATTPAAVAAQATPVVWNLPHVAAPSYYHTQNLNALSAKLK